MKVQIKDLKPNPYRDIDNYPINQAKVQSLMNSMEQTGFWDNILAREINGQIQIAYGHHRLEALRKKYKPDYEVDIPVKKLSDAIMLKMMAQENEYISGLSVAVTDETIRQTRKFLEEHPEEIKTPNPVDYRNLPPTDDCGKRGYYYSSEAFRIYEFLGWSEARIFESIKRIELEDSGILDKETIENLPTEAAANRFMRIVKSRKLKKHEQKKLAKKLHEKESYGDDAIRDALFEDDFEAMKISREEISERERERLIGFEDLIQEIIMKFKDEFDSETYDGMIKKYILFGTIERINKQTNNFLKTYSDGKEKFELSA